MNEASDIEIVKQVLGGDVDEFEVLITRHRAHVFAIVGNHVPAARVSEVAHESFVRAYKSLGSFSGRSPFPHWLSRIAVRSCYDFWRAEKRRREIPVSELTDHHVRWLEAAGSEESGERFEQEASRREAAELLERALQALSPEDRLVLTLIHGDGSSVREAADLLGWTVGRVKIHAFRSRKILRSRIEQMIEESRRGGK